MSEKVMIGIVKLFEPETGRGVIAPKNVDDNAQNPDLYFAIEKTDKPIRFREGQLVKFVKDESSSVAREVAILSETY
jgi:hypothetical protein